MEILLHIPMPWQMILVFLLIMPFVPWIILRLLPWLLVKILLVLSIFTEFIAASLFFVEYKITQNIRKNKQQPPEILYILSDILASGFRATQFFKATSERLSRIAFRIPWILSPKGWYALPLIFLPIWFIFPHFGNYSLNALINSGATWWCSFEHWTMTGEWTPSRLTCRYPKSNPRWSTFSKPREYDLKRKIQEYTREIEIKTNNPDAYYNRGNAYFDLENIEYAYRDYTVSVKVDSVFAPGYVGRGKIYFLKGDRSGAFKEYSKAVRANPKYAPGYVGRGDVYLAMKDNSSAFKEYSKAVRANPKYAPGYVGRGDVYQKIGDKEAALQEYEKAIKINPNYAPVYTSIGNLYYRNFNNRESAIKKYKKAADIFLRSGQVSSYDKVSNIINNLNKYTIHVVRRGDSLGKIANNYDVVMKSIVSANRETYPTLVTNPSNIEIGWKLKIPK